MSGGCQVPVLEWTMIVRERRDRIVTILAQMIQRRMMVSNLEEAADEWNLPEPEIGRACLTRENQRESYRSACCGVCPPVNDAAGRTPRGIDQVAVRIVEPGDGPGMVKTTCAGHR